MLRDIVGRYKVKNVKLLDDLFSYWVTSVASSISVANIINSLLQRREKLIIKHYQRI